MLGASNMDTNFISERTFNNAEKDIREFICDLWEPKLGDLFFWNDDDTSKECNIDCCTSMNVVKRTGENKGININNRSPLLSEFQIKEMIYHITSKKVNVNYEISNIKISLGELDYYSKDTEIVSLWKVLLKVCREHLDKNKQSI